MVGSNHAHQFQLYKAVKEQTRGSGKKYKIDESRVYKFININKTL